MKAIQHVLSGALMTAVLMASETDAANFERIEGLTQPFRQIELAAGEPGVLAELNVRAGDRVQAGELVAQLDTSVLEATQKIAKFRAETVGTLRGAEAELQLRQRYLDSLAQLRERGNATQREVERAQADVEVAAARVQVAKEELALQRLECKRIEAQIKRRQITSPVDGIVSQVYREVGETLLANDPRVVTIVQLEKLRAKFALLQDQASRVSVGQVVPVELLSGRKIDNARIETIAPVMDGKSATVEVTVVIPNSREAIPSGARCVLLVSGNARSDNRVTNYTSNSARD